MYIYILIITQTRPPWNCRADNEAAIGQGFVRGAGLLAEVEHRIAMVEGDVSPPLTAGEGLTI